MERELLLKRICNRLEQIADVKTLELIDRFVCGLLYKRNT